MVGQVIPQGNSFNPVAPGLYVYKQNPQQVLINGVDTNLILFVGTAAGGPVNAVQDIGTMQEFIQYFGMPQANYANGNAAQYDMGIQVFAAVQQFAQNMKCVRVTDGTDTAASAAIKDTTSVTPLTAMILAAIYTGSLGNALKAIISAGSNSTVSNPTFRIDIQQPNQPGETFDNIGGTGSTLWKNIANAINLGQSGLRGPSKLVVASLNTSITGVTITTPGSYATLPALGITGAGAGASLSPIMKAVSAAIAVPGSGYTAGDVLTVVGGTNSLSAQITIDTVDGSGNILTAHVSRAGSYTVLPTSPVSVTGGTGSSATFTLLWGLLSAVVNAGGDDYENTSALTVTGGGSTGGGAGTLIIGASLAPALASYPLTSGTDGNNGVTAASLIGNDGAVRTGMYAFRNLDQPGLLVLCGNSDSGTFAEQVAFADSEGHYALLTGPAGESISSAKNIRLTLGLDSTAFKQIVGDWVYIQDSYNNITRLISPQAFFAGRLANLLPNESSLNKPLFGIIGTQTTQQKLKYSNADLADAFKYNLDLIYSPSPGGNYFAAVTGLCGSSNLLTRGDKDNRLTNYLAYSISDSLGEFVGDLQTPTTRANAKSALISFLQSLADQQIIGNISGGPAFVVTLDNTNNSQTTVQEGYMIANVTVYNFQVVYYFVINLTNGALNAQLVSTQPAQQ